MLLGVYMLCSLMMNIASNEIVNTLFPRYQVTEPLAWGGYLWAISSIEQEQLQVRCLEETHMIEIRPPLQIVYLGNGCEGYSPSMFLPAKNEMTTHAQIESRREYFLQFNYVYTPDRYIGLWW